MTAEMSVQAIEIGLIIAAVALVIGGVLLAGGQSEEGRRR